MPSVRKSYDEELLQLDTLLARMGHEAGAAIESALTALRNDDIELARSVVARDSQIDASEHEIEHRCLQLLLRQQPVASDLRKVSTALKMVTDVERIGSEIAQYIAAHPTEAETALDLFMVTKYLERLGDHAVNVAEWVEFLKTGVHKSRKIV